MEPDAALKESPAAAEGVLDRRKVRRRWLRIWKALLPFARRHRADFRKSCAAAFGVVAFRLALPWPIRGVLGPYLSADAPSEQPWYADPWSIGLLFLFIVVGLGYSDFRQRVYVARFSIAWVRDIRAEAFRAANRLDPRSLTTSSGDLVARLVGDTARLKAGLKGFQTHVAVNGVFFLGVCAVMLWIDWMLGLIVLGAGVCVFLVTLEGATRLYQHYLKLRKKEGKLAGTIQEALSENPQEARFVKVNYSSGHHETNVVRIQGRTTLAAHVILGIATCAVLVLAFHGLDSGRIQAADMLVFFIYLVDVHRPAVRLCRQGTRFGKMMACGNRLERIIHDADRDAPGDEDLPPLRKRLVLKHVLVQGSDRNRVGPLDLSLRAGEKVALLGPPGAGKSSLLAAVAGKIALDDGKILWDGHKLHKAHSSVLTRHIASLAENPGWLRQSLRGLVLGGTERPESVELLQWSGASAVLTMLEAGLDQRVSSSDLSRRQARSLDLARVMHQDASLLLLDDPLRDLEPSLADKVRTWILDTPATVLVAFADPAAAVGFSRVVQLRSGLLVEDGPPSVPPAP